MNTNSKLGPRPTAIILAAGEAKRFGAVKQVLVWQGQTLVERAVRACLDADCKQVVVVTGAHADEVTSALQVLLQNEAVATTHNSDWAQGMHTSIACGMKALLEDSATFDAVLVLTVDQPRIDAEFLRKLIQAQTVNDASALAYPSGAGVPACFGASLFSKLTNLSTTGGGAKAILRDKAVKTALINDPERRLDIDTFTDWNDFKLTNH